MTVKCQDRLMSDWKIETMNNNITVHNTSLRTHKQTTTEGGYVLGRARGQPVLRRAAALAARAPGAERGRHGRPGRDMYVELLLIL